MVRGHHVHGPHSVRVHGLQGSVHVSVLRGVEAVSGGASLYPGIVSGSPNYLLKQLILPYQLSLIIVSLDPLTIPAFISWAQEKVTSSPPGSPEVSLHRSEWRYFCPGPGNSNSVRCIKLVSSHEGGCRTVTRTCITMSSVNTT